MKTKRNIKVKTTNMKTTFLETNLDKFNNFKSL